MFCRFGANGSVMRLSKDNEIAVLGLVVSASMILSIASPGVSIAFFVLGMIAALTSLAGMIDQTYVIKRR